MNWGACSDREDMTTVMLVERLIYPFKWMIRSDRYSELLLWSTGYCKTPSKCKDVRCGGRNVRALTSETSWSFVPSKQAMVGEITAFTSLYI
jgi:hypothetical protein